MSEIERCGLQTIYETPYTCTYCGDHIAVGWAFCPECGTATGQGAAELDREKNPLTWNERINQMTVEDKADYALTFDMCAAELQNPHDFCDDKYLYKTGMQHNGRYHDCRQCWIDKLNSPYTEGETK